MPDFRQHLEVETPEHVVLDYEIAGVGSRALAALIDTAILAVWLIALAVVTAQLPVSFGRWADAVFVLVNFASIWGYYTFFEGLRQGQTPGKKRIGLRVVRDTGHPVTVGAAAARNLLRLADILPPPYFLGGLLVALHPRAKRLGDMVAGTVVVRDRPVEVHLAEPARAGTAAEEDQGLPDLTDEEFRLLREFSERAPTLDEAVRRRFADRLAARFAERFPTRPASNLGFLADLYRNELARRRGRFGARTGGGGPRGSSSIVERMVARKSERWDQFQALAERGAADGLDSFAAAELPDFAARYREVAADLARARTYGASPTIQARLERLVAAGHNLLYRDERQTAARVWEVISRECPAAVVEARRYVLLAFLVFALPAAGGFLLLRERPALAPEVLPDVMLRRAEAGAERIGQGRGYVEVEAKVRPVISSQIISNNIGVAFACFAGGIFAGVGSLVLLAFNGLSFGAIAGHFANVGLLGYLLTFVVGHGVLELFSVWVAGAAGFLLGRSLIAPGDLTRADALVLSGRLAVRMIGAVIVLLLIAGSIEGFVSTSQQSLAVRLSVSGASAVFLVLYLLNGARYLRSRTGS